MRFLPRSLALSLLLSLSLAPRADAQPTTLTAADFVHANAPHWPQFSPAAGANARPVLVVFVRFDDSPSADEGAIARRIFGPGFPNLVDYFRDVSYGRLVLTPARESFGTANNGVVVVNAGSRAAYLTPTSPGSPKTSWDRELRRNRIALELADPFVDFASFDRRVGRGRGDGLVDNRELVVLVIHEGNERQAQKRPVQGPLTLDGKTIRVEPAMASSGAALGVIIHEASHALLDHRDTYGWNTGWFSIGGGPDTGAGEPSLFHFNAWEKMHAGWLTPTLPAKDGWVTLRRADRFPEAVLLADPKQGAQHYLMLEYRVPTRGTYENDTPDRGLLVTRVDERRPADNDLMMTWPLWPAGQAAVPAGDQYAWDPTDARTPQRELVRPAWGDGAASRFSIRAIQAPTSESIRFYVDMPGPGLLADCFDAKAPGHVKTLHLRPGTEGRIDVALMNTGELNETIDLDVRAPGPITGSGARGLILVPERAQSAALTLRAPAGLADGEYTVRATVRSRRTPSLTDSCEVKVRVATPRVGYVYYAGPSPLASLEAASYSYNSSGGANRVVRTGTGVYRASFQGLDAVGGIAQVVSTGAGPARCRVARFWSTGGAAWVEVVCATVAGVAVDGTFAVLFGNVPASPPSFAYAYIAGARADGTADVPREYQFNSAGGVITGRAVSPGDWQVRIPGGAAALVGGVAHVTAYGSASGACGVRALAPDASTGDALLRVSCSSIGGLARYVPFALSVARGVGLTGTSRTAGYVSLTGASPVSIFAAYPTETGRATVVRSGAGRHTVRFPGLGVRGGTVHVSPYVSSSRGWPMVPHCRVVTWRAEGRDEVVEVACSDDRGAPHDAAFALSFMH